MDEKKSPKKQKILRVGLYARKSKFTGKGESINNQIDVCKRYMSEHSPEDIEVEIRVYADEGVSGKDLERPQMRELLREIEDGHINVLICYRLDRVSRSVRDFSDLLELLEERSVQFISVNESFDTGTPMGRAMMMIASVFSQLERETITERLRDNMCALARLGRWLGGRTPLGFRSLKVIEEDSMGKKRSRHRLDAIPEEVELVRLIFQKYHELGSLTKLEQYLMVSGYKTKQGKIFGRYSLRAMLSNPVYCIADLTVLSFLRDNNYGVFAEQEWFDGSHGLIAYNKNNNTVRKQRENDVEDWIVSVGEHEGVINSELWIDTQKRLRENGKLSFRKPQKTTALFSGVVRCKACGGYMRPKSSRKAKDGTMRYSYVCETKEKSRGALCQMPNILGRQLDDLIVEDVLELREQIVTEYGFLQEELERLERTSYAKSEEHILGRQIEENKKQMEALISALAKSKNEAATNAILDRLNQMSEEQEALQKKLDQLSEGKTGDLVLKPEKLLAGQILQMPKERFMRLSAVKQKMILKEVVKEIIWDGENAEVHFLAEDFPEVKSA